MSAANAMTAPASNGIQQASHEMSHRYNRGAIVHPLHQEYIDPMTGRTNSTRVTPAVRTRVLPPENEALAARPQKSAVPAAFDGVMMFGPGATSNAKPKASIPTSALSLDQPIDMTPEEPAAGRSNFRLAPGAQASFSEHNTAVESQNSGIAGRVRQPADAPIAIQ